MKKNILTVFVFVVSVVCLFSMAGSLACSSGKKASNVDPNPSVGVVTTDATPVATNAPDATAEPVADVGGEVSLDSTPVLPVSPAPMPVVEIK